ncbi:alpha/beta hydrolase [Geotoga petraea]|jgi:acetyl esterase/lipase|uniref:Acetyl esterase/lipase n=1 Tax=Geotoga petraea TaxID=28234 RepID=A0A1G6JPW3_9BACT|nr:alpha/beta hydrolase [Geotoga petraea]SDC20780.1 Acetyl esterase/lipase [Geotoga petraea]
MKKYNNFVAFLHKSKSFFRFIYVFFILIFSFIYGGIVLVIAFFTYSTIYILNLLFRKLPLNIKKDVKVKTVHYKTTKNKKKLKMDIYYPEKKQEKYPTVLFAHGGGWISGFRRQANNVSWCKYLAVNGFLVCSIDYRLGISNTMDEILEDYEDALKYIKNNNNELKVDKSKINLMGLSAGGHLSFLYAAYHSAMMHEEEMKGIKSLIIYYTPYDLKDIFNKDVKSLFAKFAVLSTMKSMPEANELDYEFYSPKHWMNENLPPVLIAHGKLDDTVPFCSSVKIAKKLKHLNVPYEFLVHKKGGHTFEFYMNDYQTIKIIKRTINFLKRMNK